MKHIALIIIAVVIALIIYKQTQSPAESELLQENTLDATQQNGTTTEGTESQPLPEPVKSLITNAPENARVFIIEPQDGAVVSTPVTVIFGIENMTIAPAGDNQDNSGHHHLLINLDELPDMSLPLPATDQIVHFGKGQTETTLVLEPGTHKLQLLLGNYLHIPHNKPVISEPITITVAEPPVDLESSN